MGHGSMYQIVPFRKVPEVPPAATAQFLLYITIDLGHNSLALLRVCGFELSRVPLHRTAFQIILKNLARLRIRNYPHTPILPCAVQRCASVVARQAHLINHRNGILPSTGNALLGHVVIITLYLNST
jgi:hypothetical protein